MSKTAIQTAAAPAAIGPYSQGIVVQGGGHWVYLSGQVALDPQTQTLIKGDAAEQTDRAMKNLHAVLREAGGDLQHLVKTNIYLSDLNDFARVNEVYASFLSKPFPARATVQVARLPRDAAVEIDGVAFIPG